MTALITRVIDEYWYDIKEVFTIEELYDLMNKYDNELIVRKNVDYTTPEDFDFWIGMNKEDIPKIIKAEIHVIIYDDYIE